MAVVTRDDKPHFLNHDAIALQSNTPGIRSSISPDDKLGKERILSGSKGPLSH